MFCHRKDQGGLKSVMQELETLTEKLAAGEDVAQVTAERMQAEAEDARARMEEAAKERAQAAAKEGAQAVAARFWMCCSRKEDGKQVKTGSDEEVKKKLEEKAEHLRSWQARLSKVQCRLRILISLIQVLTPMGIVYSIPFPPVYEQMLRWLNVFQ
eukprot:6014645-Prymnesium_polylepis.1